MSRLSSIEGPAFLLFTTFEGTFVILKHPVRHHRFIVANLWVISAGDRALSSTFCSQNIYFYIIVIMSCLAQLSSYFSALIQATINLIIPEPEMRQNINSTVITASHQS